MPHESTRVIWMASPTTSTSPMGRWWLGGDWGVGVGSVAANVDAAWGAWEGGAVVAVAGGGGLGGGGLGAGLAAASGSAGGSAWMEAGAAWGRGPVAVMVPSGGGSCAGGSETWGQRAQAPSAMMSPRAANHRPRLPACRSARQKRIELVFCQISPKAPLHGHARLWPLESTVCLLRRLPYRLQEGGDPCRRIRSPRHPPPLHLL